MSLLLAFAAAPFGAEGGQYQGARLSARGAAAEKAAPVTALDVPPGDSQLQLDDGSYESARGVTYQSGNVFKGNQSVYINLLNPDASLLPLTIDSVSVLFPASDQYGPTGVVDGQTFQILVYVDEDGTGNPAQAHEVSRVTFDVHPSNTEFQTVALPEAVTVTRGYVWVGFTDTVTSVTNDAIYPGALDETAPQGYSYVFYNTTPASHFDGTDLGSAGAAEVVPGNWLIRANYQTGGEVTLCWSPGSGGDTPAPANLQPCGMTKAESVEGTRGTLQYYNVYRSGSPNVQPMPANYFTSVPPGMTTVSSSVSASGTFFVVTGVYDTGMSGPSNEVGFKPATVATVAIKKGNIKATGTGFTTAVQVFIDGIPFVTPAKVKTGTKVTQKGNLLTGQSIRTYLALHGNVARVSFRNSDGTTAAANLGKQ